MDRYSRVQNALDTKLRTTYYPQPHKQSYRGESAQSEKDARRFQAESHT